MSGIISARKHFGAKGDGVTDDTAALQAAFDEWAIQAVSTPNYYRTTNLVIDPGVYKITSEIDAVLSGGIWVGGAIMAQGAVLHSAESGPDIGLRFDTDSQESQTFVRNMDIYGLTLDGCGLQVTGNQTLTEPAKSLWKFGLHQTQVANSPTHGFDINAFEVQCFGLRSYVSGSSDHCFRFENSSSVDMFGCTSNGGKHGIYAGPAGSELRVFGGTFLETDAEAIYILSAMPALLDGVHCEMNWITPGSTSIRPAIFAEGRVTVVGPTVSAHPDGNVTHAVRVYAVGSAQMIGGVVTGQAEDDVTSFAYITGDSGSVVTLIGQDSYESSGSVGVASLGGVSTSVVTPETSFELSNVSETFSLDPTTATAADVANYLATLARRRLGHS